MKQIPNIITCLNLFSGCLACVMILVHGNYTGALFFVLLASLFDFLDGLAARVLRAYSPIGAQLDSLADVISFGLAPACVVFSFLSEINSSMPFSIALFAFLIAIFSALRLAKFNIDSRQSTSFFGLPVPANGLFWVSFLFSLSEISNQYETFFAEKAAIISGIILVLIALFCLLMISEIPMFSLKIKKLSWKDNQKPLLLAGFCLLFIFSFILLDFNFGLIIGLTICSTVIIYIFLSLIPSK